MVQIVQAIELSGGRLIWVSTWRFGKFCGGLTAVEGGFVGPEKNDKAGTARDEPTSLLLTYRKFEFDD